MQNPREKTRAILHYENFDSVPVVHFGWWTELLEKWTAEGHLSAAAEEKRRNKIPIDNQIGLDLGFDFPWDATIETSFYPMPGFENKIVAELPDGFFITQNGAGQLQKWKPNINSPASPVGTLLKGRKEWEELYLPRLQPSIKRYNAEYIRNTDFAAITDHPVILHLGSLYGSIRDMLGVTELSYLQADDEELYAEIISTMGSLCYENTRAILEMGVRPDSGHYWEDICFKNGPLVNPVAFRKYVAPQYRRISDLLAAYGVDIISLDCDGCIDRLVPIWLESGVNTMFPIEVGTWGGSLAPWRAQYGKALRGVGGINKFVFEQDYQAVDREIERLRPMIEDGGYIPCPDHRLTPGAKWEVVQYYCEKMRSLRV
ncbi:MAG TPA: hypothetical protein DD640_10490 [Clostridiales bacterium]|nr:hypothetical protein [Clostridiales bacterium]